MKKLLTLVLIFGTGFYTSCSDDTSLNLVSAFSYEKHIKTVSFQNASSDYESLLWDFGDGTTSSQENPVHEFQDFESYSITLSAFNGDLVDNRIVIIDLISKFQKRWTVNSAIQTTTTFGQVNSTLLTDQQSNQLLTYLLSAAVSSKSNALKISFEQSGEVNIDGVSVRGVSSWNESGGVLLVNSTVDVVSNNDTPIVGELNEDGKMTLSIGNLGSIGSFPSEFHPPGLPLFVINAINVDSIVFQLSAN